MLPSVLILGATMNSEEVLKLFRIPATKLITHTEVSKWRRILQDYREYDLREVEEELQDILDTHGENCSTLWYLSEVRKKMELRNHYSLKRLPMIESIRQMFK